ncbi:hypothetical protein L861_06375 [Litchfieldella anticariensis FP35 = DSM 16096]|uniref:Uncharacterized protein n=1 Tax=Litchfieldella anticariensis (strain DSM 16096 / CECT 5854 / CIP 108499 / LMG 22089 / FP35) TaxID=1121939 RepID=S2KYT3_LITA3|nr:hypothetical protein [Halomonas anticariensis]EPC00559.1 hypothetical protein L861_06375 [Halomonas anticariensis FP35 = DSM 16096]
MKAIQAVLFAEPIADLVWDRILLLRSLGLDGRFITVNSFESPMAARYEAGDANGTESPGEYGMEPPAGYELIFSGPSEDGESVWALYARPLTPLGEYFMRELDEARVREAMP